MCVTLVSVENKLVTDVIDFVGGYKDHRQDTVEPREFTKGNKKAWDRGERERL